MRSTIRRWEIFGALFIIVLGTPWHYVFTWSGGWQPVALFFPVNESTWEHMKLFVWPALIWAAIEYPFIGRRVKAFWPAKGAALLIMAVVMALFFYSYKAVLGRSVLWANLLDFALAVAAGQWVSYRILTGPSPSRSALLAGGLGLALLLVLFLSLSFYPPHLFLFEDPNFRAYGIVPLR